MQNLYHHCSKGSRVVATVLIIFASSFSTAWPYSEGMNCYFPLRRVHAAYPEKARNEGIEGYCAVEFSVGTTGTVQDVSIVECEPVGYFESASLKAAARFKYRSRVDGNVTISVPIVRQIFWFAYPDTETASIYKAPEKYKLLPSFERLMQNVPTCN